MHGWRHGSRFRRDRRQKRRAEGPSRARTLLQSRDGSCSNSPPPGGEGLGVGGIQNINVRQSPPPYPSHVVSKTRLAVKGEGKTRHFRLLLDGKPVRTPAKKQLLLPTRALADAVAAEWEDQKVRIDPVTMPLTRLANSAIDGVTGPGDRGAGRHRQVRRQRSRLLPRGGPAGTGPSSGEAWDPVLAWAREALGASFHVVQGIMPTTQPAPAAHGVARAIDAHGPFELAALHVMTTLMGSPCSRWPMPAGTSRPMTPGPRRISSRTGRSASGARTPRPRPAATQRWLEMQAASRRSSCSAEPLTSAVSSRFAVQYARAMPLRHDEMKSGRLS